MSAVAKRLVVREFAEQMELRLLANDHKGGWEGMDRDELFRRLEDEVEELFRALITNRSGEVAREAADVANYAMMIADQFGDLS